MGWTASVEATPAKVAEELDKLDPPEREEERDQAKAAIAAAKKLVDTVSKRERVLVTIMTHSDPDSDGFNPRMAAVSVSRVDPEAARQQAELQAQADAANQAVAEPAPVDQPVPPA